MTYILWIIQVLLALLFLFAGGTKLVLPIETLMSMGSPNAIPLPGLFVRFIGVCEVLGALGLVLPGLLRISARPDTPGRRRTGDHHDRSDSAHVRGRWYRDGAAAARGGTSFSFRRLRPLAAGTAPRSLRCLRCFSQALITT